MPRLDQRRPGTDEGEQRRGWTKVSGLAEEERLVPGEGGPEDPGVLAVVESKEGVLESLPRVDPGPEVEGQKLGKKVHGLEGDEIAVLGRDEEAKGGGVREARSGEVGDSLRPVEVGQSEVVGDRPVVLVGDGDHVVAAEQRGNLDQLVAVVPAGEEDVRAGGVAEEDPDEQVGVLREESREVVGPGGAQSEEHLGKQTSCRPGVNRQVIVADPQKQLRRLVVLGGDPGAEVGVLRRVVLGQSPVNDLEEAPARVNDDVLGLDVPVEDPQAVRISQTPHELAHVVLEVPVAKTGEKGVEGPVPHVLHHEPNGLLGDAPPPSWPSSEDDDLPDHLPVLDALQLLERDGRAPEDADLAVTCSWPRDSARPPRQKTHSSTGQTRWDCPLCTDSVWRRPLAQTDRPERPARRNPPPWPGIQVPPDLPSSASRRPRGEAAEERKSKPSAWSALSNHPFSWMSQFSSIIQMLALALILNKHEDFGAKTCDYLCGPETKFAFLQEQQERRRPRDFGLVLHQGRGRGRDGGCPAALRVRPAWEAGGACTEPALLGPRGVLLRGGEVTKCERPELGGRGVEELVHLGQRDSLLEGGQDFLVGVGDGREAGSGLGVPGRPGRRWADGGRSASGEARGGLDCAAPFSAKVPADGDGAPFLDEALAGGGVASEGGPGLGAKDVVHVVEEAP
ncbi:hypothetical protein OIY81_2072 [Cryptosporidium canis]|nr:hypothetical protein OIY81_2072 [Cryptosporidium canis]